MYARAVDDAATRLRELRRDEWEGLALGALALTLALAATQVRPSLAVPLFLGGLVVGGRGLAAGVRRSELVEWLVRDRDAYAIAEVRAHAAREATMRRRTVCAAWIRAVLELHRTDVAPDLAEPLLALAVELDDAALVLDPSAAVACTRLVEDEALLVRDLLEAPAAVRARVDRIRAGFSPSTVG
jgi:hypothetical protein